MTRMIFVNLPVRDLPRSRAFYEALGFINNPQFSDETAACMVWSETIHVMILTHDKWRTFTSRPIPPSTSSEVLLCVSCDSREAVDAMNEAAAAHGGTADINPKQDHGFMYNRNLADPDGHVWKRCGWTRRPWRRREAAGESDVPDIELTAFSWVPPTARGLVRDLRVRWALEEIGQPYATRLFDRRVSGPEDRRPDQPFGQVPIFREGEVTMFESGAICLHLAERSDILLPGDAPTRARALSWTVAALSSVEPYITMMRHVCLMDADKPGAAEFAPAVEARLAARLEQLAAALGERDWIAGPFTVADIIMVCVLRQLRLGERLAAHPSLAAYVARGQARPAFARALAAQMADFEDSEAGDANDQVAGQLHLV